MSGQPILYRRGNRTLTSRFCKIIHQGAIKFVRINDDDNEGGHIQGQQLFTLSQYSELMNVPIQRGHESSFTEHMTELIFCMNEAISFDVDCIITEICVHDVRTFDDEKNRLVSRPGQEYTFVVKWFCLQRGNALEEICNCGR